MKRLRLVVAAGPAAVALTATSGVAFGADPFLCPIVGDGVTNADAHNGDNGVFDIGPLPGSGDASILPAGGGDKDQAGANSNPNGHNTLGPGASPGPGDGNSDWSPIWPAS